MLKFSMKIPRSRLEIKTYETQPLTHDTDIVAICPTAPEFAVTGTYSLVKKGETEDYRGQLRYGTINVKRVEPTFESSFPGQLLPILANHRLPAAVLDVHFHPQDLTLIAASLSNTEVRFFRFVKRADILSRRIITELLPLGTVKVADKDQYDQTPLVTQFHWMEMYEGRGSEPLGTNTITTCFAATTSSYEVRTVKVKIPGIKSSFDYRLAHKPRQLDLSAENVQWHANEAWTVSSILRSTENDSMTNVILSGGDDCKLISATSHIDMSTHASEHSVAPTLPLWTDSKSHGYGVTAIMPIPPPIPTTTSHLQPAIPLLTGSYDEHLRLFTLNPHTMRREPLQPVADFDCRAGAWRIKLIDHYIIPHAPSSPTQAANDDSALPHPNSNRIPSHATHYILLIASMHAGVNIVRLVHDPTTVSVKNENPNYTHIDGTPWSIAQVAYTIEGHNTLCYTADTKRQWESPYHTIHNSVANDHARGSWDTEVNTLVGGLLKKASSKLIRVDLPWMTDTENDIKQDGKGPKNPDSAKLHSAPGTHPIDNNNSHTPGTAVKDLPRRHDWKDRLDWQQRKKWQDNVGRHSVVSCGFYDRHLCHWEFRDKLRQDGLDVLEFLEGCAAAAAS